ncbi:MAG: NrfD/PsrC family molybdoenzyme membrane anchor subunit, partial [Halobacteriaceae archaeon]
REAHGAALDPEPFLEDLEQRLAERRGESPPAQTPEEAGDVAAAADVSGPTVGTQEEVQTTEAVLSGEEAPAHAKSDVALLPSGPRTLADDLALAAEDAARKAMAADTEITQTIADQEVQARKPEKGTEPKLFYVDGDEGSITPGTTGREDHYMWSDAPHDVEHQGAAREEFDLQRAAESLAESDVTLSDAGAEDEARADGGEACACGGDCGCGDGGDGVASDGGYSTAAADTGSAGADAGGDSRAARAYELLHEEAERVYDVGEDHYRSWGWEVYSYTWTKSISAGVFLVPALLMLAGVVEPNATTVGVSALVSTVFLALTGVLLILDLEQPRRFHWVLLRPNWRSWLVKGAYIITAFGAYLGLVVAGWLAGVEAATGTASLAVGSALATATAVYTAFLFSQSKGRDLWQSPAMPLHMFAQAVVAGGATVALLGWVGVAGFDALMGGAQAALGGGLVVHGALVASEILTPHQTEDAEEAAARITRGEFRRAFWLGGVGIGLALPLWTLVVAGAVAAAASMTNAGVLVALAGVLSLAGLLAFEYCWITAPQTISLA